MNRRDFLQRLTAAVAALPAYRAAALVRDFGVPTVGLKIGIVREMAPLQSARNQLLSPSLIAKEALKIFERQQLYLEGVKHDE